MAGRGTLSAYAARLVHTSNNRCACAGQREGGRGGGRWARQRTVSTKLRFCSPVDCSRIVAMDWRTLPTLILEAIAAAKEEQGGVDRGWWSPTLAARKLALVAAISAPSPSPRLPPPWSSTGSIQSTLYNHSIPLMYLSCQGEWPRVGNGCTATPFVMFCNQLVFQQSARLKTRPLARESAPRSCKNSIMSSGLESAYSVTSRCQVSDI